MKHIITIAIALLAASPMSARAGEIVAPQFETVEHRILVAEVMTDRLTDILAKATAACARAQALIPKIAEDCRTSISNLLPTLKIIRQVAASGDNVRWAGVIEVVHKLETEMQSRTSVMEAALHTLGK